MGATRDYRVIVTDGVNDEVMETATIVADAGGLLCQTSLLVASFYNSRVVRYSFRSYQPEIFVTSGSGGLNGASKITCGPDGNLYVSSQNDDRVRRFDGATGAFIDIFVTAGSGGLNVPVGLGFGPDGNLYVASAANHSVMRYDGVTGAFVDVFVPNGSGLNNPTGLTWGPDDRLCPARVTRALPSSTSRVGPSRRCSTATFRQAGTSQNGMAAPRTALRFPPAFISSVWKRVGGVSRERSCFSNRHQR